MQIQGKCEICGVNIKSADNQAQYNRNLGLHKRTRHGIAGKKYVPRKARNPEMENPELEIRVPQTREEINAERRRKYQENYRRLRKQQQQPSSNVVPALLSQCCVCGARFYVAKGQQ